MFPNKQVMCDVLQHDPKHLTRLIERMVDQECCLDSSQTCIDPLFGDLNEKSPVDTIDIAARVALLFEGPVWGSSRSLFRCVAAYPKIFQTLIREADVNFQLVHQRKDLSPADAKHYDQDFLNAANALGPDLTRDRVVFITPLKRLHSKHVQIGLGTNSDPGASCSVCTDLTHAKRCDNQIYEPLSDTTLYTDDTIVQGLVETDDEGPNSDNDDEKDVLKEGKASDSEGSGSESGDDSEESTDEEEDDDDEEDETEDEKEGKKKRKL
jgi:hypothetical protein